MNQVGGNGSGNGNAHSGETVGNNACIGFIAVVMASRPDFVGPHVGNNNVIRPHDFTCINEDFLGLHGKGCIVAILFVFGNHFFANL